MAFTLQTSTLNRVHAILSGERGRLYKIDQWIDALQGSGSQSLNTVVNDLVFLKRALLSKEPNKGDIRTLVVQLTTRAKELGQEAPVAFRPTFTDMWNTFRTLQQ